jgi:hypothetical protein
VVVALLAALYALGKFNGSSDNETATTPKTSTTTTTTVPRPASSGATSKRKKHKKKSTAASKLVRLQIVPTGPGPVFVCAQDAAGDLRIPGVSLQQGIPTGTYRSRSFKIRLGNGNAVIRANGKSYPVPDVSPIGYSVTRKGVRRIDVNQTPNCVR